MAGNQAQQSKNEKEKFMPKLQTWSDCDFIQVRATNIFSLRNEAERKKKKKKFICQNLMALDRIMLRFMTATPHGTR